MIRIQRKSSYVLVASFLLAFLSSGLNAAKENQEPKAISLDENSFWISQGFDDKWLDVNPEGLDKMDQWFKHQGTPIELRLYSQGKSPNPMQHTVITYFDLPDYSINSTKTLGIVFPSLGENWQIFINGHRIASQLFLDDEGKIRIHRTVRWQIFQLPTHLLKSKGNQLTLRLLGNPGYSMTGLYYAPGLKIEDYDKLLAENSELINFALFFLYMFVGIYHLLLFYKRRNEKYNLMFGLFSVAVFIYFLSRSNTVFSLVRDTLLISRIEYIVVFLLVPLFIAFLEEFFFRKISKIALGYSVLCLLLAILIPFFYMIINDYILKVWQFSTLIFLIYIFYMLVKAVRQKIIGAWFMVIGMIAMILSSVMDIVDSMLIHSGVAFTKYVFLLFIVGIAVYLANRFLQVHNAVEELNENLEKKVSERTKQLQKTLEKVQALKVQQDGDYFLTSLLIKPLANIYCDCNDIISIEGYSRQKKQFEFKKWQAEIGGDIVIADMIKLREKEYVVFLNGDAMGKSIQGAGGALVLGVVFNAYLARSKMVEMYRNRFPEQWLKDCFSDLQSVFQAFDGTMLASLVMGLVDKENGFVYYLNAEHPWTVLYRDKVAEFIEDETTLLRKVGVTIFNRGFSVRTFALEKGDVLFIGSDGRDDIALKGQEEHKRVLNEDETLFLRNIEHSKGQMAELVEAINSYGELTDDLTLLKIAYHGDTSIRKRLSHDNMPTLIKKHIEQAQIYYRNKQYNLAELELEFFDKEENLHPLVWELLYRIALKKKRYDQAAMAGYNYCSLNPDNNEMIFLTSYANKRAGNLPLACDFAERLHIRQPEEINNLLNLVDIYRKMENLNRGKAILEKVLSLQPNNETALRLRKMIYRKTVNA